MSAIKFLLYKFQQSLLQNLRPGAKMMAKNVKFDRTCCCKLTYPLRKMPTSMLFQLYCHRHRASDKIQLSLMGNFPQPEDKGLTFALVPQLLSPKRYFKNFAIRTIARVAPSLWHNWSTPSLRRQGRSLARCKVSRSVLWHDKLARNQLIEHPSHRTALISTF